MTCLSRATVSVMRAGAGVLVLFATVSGVLGGRAATAPLERQVKSSVPSADDPEEQVKHLVVMIRGALAESETIGAGIIVGLSRSRIYIATANHVVRRGTDEARNLKVAFRWLPGEPVEAVLLSHSDAVLDLAVLAVADPASLGAPRLPFDRLGTPSELERGDPVYFIGFPNGKAWHSRVSPDPISQRSLDALRFESTFLAEGHSGGALLDRRWQLVGLIRSDQPPEGEAVSIDRVLEKLREWNYPVRLTKPADTSARASTSTTAEIRYFAVEQVQAGLALCYSIENAVSARITPDIGDLDPKTLRRGCVLLPSPEPTRYMLLAVGRDGQGRARSLEKWPATTGDPAGRSFQPEVLVTSVEAHVTTPERPNAVLAVRKGSGDASLSGPCPRELLFVGSITTNGPVTVVYRWERSDGITVGPRTLEFRTAGALKPEPYSWSLGRSEPDYSRTFHEHVTLVVLKPNPLSSRPVSFLLECRNRD